MYLKPDSSLLITKLSLPPLRSKLISRNNLYDNLNKGLEDGTHLVLVTAPAGYGKTVLIRSWLNEINYQSGWLSLDKDDNNPITFWSYFLLSIVKTLDVGETAWALLHSSKTPPIETILTSLLNDLAKKENPFLIVLDDYHVIKNDVINKGISFLIDHFPPQISLVMISREKPSLPLAKLRACRQLLELHSSDLQFTNDQTDVFINQVMQLNLSRDKIEYLRKYTSGWVAGLQMAAISMQGLDPNDASDFIRRMNQSEDYIMEYLLEEVFNSQPKVIQNYLIRTSILDLLNDELCNFIADFDGKGLPEIENQSMLEYLTSKKLFTFPMSNDSKWYRYHDLFSDFLYHHLEKTEPDIMFSLHHKASDWYEKHNYHFEAFKHALFCKDDQKSIEMVEKYTLPMIMKGEVASAENWLNLLPEKFLQIYPRVCINKAWIMFRTGRLREVEHLLQQAENTLKSAYGKDSAANAGMHGEITAIRAAIMDLNGQNTIAINILQKTIENLPKDQIFSRCICKLFLSQSLARSEGYTNETAQVFTKSISLCQQSGNLENFMLIITGVVNEIAKKYIWQGHLQKAKSIVQDALDLITTEGLNHLPTVCHVFNGLGKVFLESYDLEEAEKYLQNGLILDPSGVTDASIECYLTLARVKQASGKDKDVQEIFEKLSSTMNEYDNPEKIETVGSIHVECQLGQGNAQEADSWFKNLGLDPSGPTATDETLNGRRRLLRNSAYVMLSRSYLLSKQYSSNLRLLEQLLSFTQSTNWIGQTIELLGIQALTYEALGNSQLANQAIEESLALAEPEGYARAFLDKGNPMISLLGKNLSTSKHPQYIKHLLNIYPLKNQILTAQKVATEISIISEHQESEPVKDKLNSTSHKNSSIQNDLYELLSDREIDVLKLLAQRFSDREIAASLFLSVNTVKGHNRNIYQKLGVTGRRQAMKKALEYHLIKEIF